VSGKKIFERLIFSMIIRSINENDCEEFLLLSKALDQETQFMMFEPGERTMTVDEQRQRIKNLLSQDNQMIFVAEHESRLVGFVGAFGGNFLRNHHCAYLVMGILQAFTGQGLGMKVFTVLEEWALKSNIHRLELTVMSHNERAINLYRKMGYQMEGIKKDSLLVNGAYVDEYYMAKLLG
jgi:RimJ/RimL family protein N-acetyltransferase